MNAASPSHLLHPRALQRRARARGMTLIEVLIVMALIALVLSAVVMGTGQMGSSRLRHSATMLTGAIRIGFSHATATSKTVRIVMDFGTKDADGKELDPPAIWLEEGDQPHLVQSKDTSGTGGAQASTMAEQQALADSGRILQGPTAPRTAFKEIDPMGLVASDPGKGHKALERGIRFRQVQTSHDDDWRKDGRAYLYFWPGGQTESAAIQMKVGDSDDEHNAITLLVAPLTGKVTIKDGAVELPKPINDKEKSDRDDPGSF